MNSARAHNSSQLLTHFRVKDFPIFFFCFFVTTAFSKDSGAPCIKEWPIRVLLFQIGPISGHLELQCFVMMFWHMDSSSSSPKGSDAVEHLVGQMLKKPVFLAYFTPFFRILRCNFSVVDARIFRSGILKIDAISWPTWKFQHCAFIELFGKCVWNVTKITWKCPRGTGPPLVFVVWISVNIGVNAIMFLTLDKKNIPNFWNNSSCKSIAVVLFEKLTYPKKKQTGAGLIYFFISRFTSVFTFWFIFLFMNLSFMFKYDTSTRIK